MGIKIIVCGLNGCGKSTLGKKLAERLGFHFFDSEDICFSKACTDYVYDYPLARSEAEKRFFEEKDRFENLVFASVTWNYASFDYAVLIEVPKDIRIQRVENRSFAEFGRRILAGGDLYEKEMNFLDFVKSRSETTVEEWLRSLRCPIIRVDGTEPVKKSVDMIVKQINNHKNSAGE